MSKIHVLPDENLGGVLREYIEVERKANAGEKIIGKNTGNIYTVLCAFSNSIETDSGKHIHHQDYFVLEPTDTIRIDGKRYRMVDRKANVGEKITETSKSAVDLLANLAQRVTELERQQKENRELIIKAFESIYGKDNVFTVEERVAMLEREVSEMYKRLRKSEEKIEMMLDDIVTLDERTQPLVAIVKAVKDGE